MTARHLAARPRRGSSICYRLAAWMGVCLWGPVAWGGPPQVLVEGLTLELVGEHPQIVTPIGMAFDGQGRLAVVESHTHQRPDDYQGPPTDRIRLVSDSDGDGRLDAWSTLTDGFHQAMNLLVRPDGTILVVTRRDVQALSSSPQPSRTEGRRTLVRLETDADYPHNGLSGIAYDVHGSRLYLGLGENLGGAYRLVGSDQSALQGDGGVGAIFTCSPEGTDLQRFSVGFWNPFSIALDPQQRVFTVDNDPDASPPCRLIHAVAGGDYGHRWEYGRAGVHPLQAWDGELPGTLPMVCGVGEAPTAVVFHAGALWVTSWGDHRIERYVLSQVGNVVSATRDVVVQGDSMFRPTGMAVAPDGSLYFADWVDRSYPVHGKGRVWRLHGFEHTGQASQPREHAIAPQAAVSSVPAAADLAAADPWIRTAAAYARAGSADDVSLDQFRAAASAERLGLLQAMRWREQEDLPILKEALEDPDQAVRLYAVRWIADEGWTQLLPQVEALLEGDISEQRYYLAVLGAIDWLTGDRSPRHSGFADGLLARELRNRSRSPAIEALALRLISPTHEAVTLARLREAIDQPDPQLRTEAIRTLALTVDPARHELLAAIADDATFADSDRADALAGLAEAREAYRGLIARLADEGPPAVRRTAAWLVPAGGAGDDETPTIDQLDPWHRLLASELGDADSGRRLFFHATQIRCGVCHRYDGRGGPIGPDLTRLGESTSRERIVESILLPSREIAPRYTPWTLQTDDGKTHLGLRVRQGGDNGQETYVDQYGQSFTLATSAIERRRPADRSIMPDRIERALTVADLRDLVAFLERPRGLLSGEAIGKSVEGRTIYSTVFGDGDDTLMVLATIHGNEAAGTPLLRKFAEWLQDNRAAWDGQRIVLIGVANPDGLAANQRTNRREVDLNRNFPAGNWNAAGGKPHGPTPLSEPESRALMRAVCQHFPDRIVSIHQPLACVDYDGPGEGLAEAMAAACDLPVRKLGGRPGSLGSFVGEVLERPIVTLELPRDAGMDAEQLWREYGQALIAALAYDQASPQEGRPAGEAR